MKGMLSMSLLRYKLDYSSLKPDEADALIKRIDSYSYTGFDGIHNEKMGYFFINDTEDLSIFQIPASCHLTRA